MTLITELLEEQASRIEEFLRSNSLRYKSNQALVLAYGRLFQERKETNLRGQPKSCYQNCHQLLLLNKDWEYCEGYAMYNDLPLPHAWLVDENGLVIEPTWKHQESQNKLEYFGIVFTRKFVMEMASKLRVYGILEEEYRLDNPFKANGFPPEALHPLFAPKQ